MSELNVGKLADDLQTLVSDAEELLRATAGVAGEKASEARDRAEESLISADPNRRPWLVLSAYFYAYIPMLLGIAAAAAGLKNAVGHPGATLPAGPAIALALGVMLFLAGDVAFRSVLGIGTPRYRAAAALLALVAWPVAAEVDAAAGIALLTVVVAGALAVERRGEHATVEA